MSVKQKLSLFEKTGDEVVKNSIVTEVPDVQPFIVGTIIKNPDHLFILTPYRSFAEEKVKYFESLKGEDEMRLRGRKRSFDEAQGTDGAKDPLPDANAKLSGSNFQNITNNTDIDPQPWNNSYLLSARVMIDSAKKALFLLYVLGSNN